MRIEDEQNKENGGDKDVLDEEKVERNEEKVDKNEKEEEEEDGGNQHTAELVVNTKPWEEATTAQTMMILQNISNTVTLNAAKAIFD